jgi:hypothetical protein
MHAGHEDWPPVLPPIACCQSVTDTVKALIDAPSLPNPVVRLYPTSGEPAGAAWQEREQPRSDLSLESRRGSIP